MSCPEVSELEKKDAEHNMHVHSRKHRTYMMVKELLGCVFIPFPLMEDMPAGLWLLHAESNGRTLWTSLQDSQHKQTSSSEAS